MKGIYILLILTLLSACYDDKGNYDYKVTPKVTDVAFLQEIDGVEEEGAYFTIPVYSTFKLRPKLMFESGTSEDTSSFTYTWIFRDQVIGTEEQLVWIPDIVLDDIEYIRLDIEDTKNDNHFLFEIGVKVTDAYSGSGFMILSEKEGITDVHFLRGDYYDMTKADFEPLLGLYQKENGESLEESAGYFKIHEHFRAGDKNTQFMIVGKHELMDINAYTFKEEKRGSEGLFMGAMPNPITDVMFMQWMDLVRDGEGKLYRRRKSTNELFHSNQFLEAPLKDNEGNVYTDMLIIPGDLGSNFCLLYDKNKKCFMTFSDWNDDFWGDNTLGKMTVLAPGGEGWPENFFPLDNMADCELIYCGYQHDAGGDVKRYFSIVRKNGRYYYQKFFVDTDYSGNFFMSVNEGDYEQGILDGFTDEMAEGNICILDYSTSYAGDKHPYLFISVGNSLYLYDTGTTKGEQIMVENVSGIQKLYEFDSPIVALDGSCINGAHLGVGLENGVFYALRTTDVVNYLMNPAIILYSYGDKEEEENFGKIIDIQYNTSNQAPSFY